jgi:hypothetical protein
MYNPLFLYKENFLVKVRILLMSITIRAFVRNFGSTVKYSDFEHFISICLNKSITSSTNNNMFKGLNYNIYICNYFALHKTMTSIAYLSPHRYLLLRQSIEACGDRVKFQHFITFLNFFFKSGMVIDHKCK